MKSTAFSLSVRSPMVYTPSREGKCTPRKFYIIRCYVYHHTVLISMAKSFRYNRKRHPIPKHTRSNAVTSNTGSIAPTIGFNIAIIDHIEQDVSDSCMAHQRSIRSNGSEKYEILI